jgi:hypothetical protein
VPWQRVGDVIRSRLTLSFGERLGLDMLVAEGPPASTEALIVPQDVNLIMGDVGAAIEDTRESAEEVLASASGGAQRRPGSIVVAPPRDGEPLVFQAVVYDFEALPPAHPDHVFEALLEAFEETHRRTLARLALKPLGTAHAGLDQATFLRLLTQVCYSSAELGSSLRQVVLLLPSPGELLRYEALLREQMEPSLRRRGAR